MSKRMSEQEKRAVELIAAILAGAIIVIAGLWLLVAAAEGGAL